MNLEIRKEEVLYQNLVPEADKIFAAFIDNFGCGGICANTISKLKRETVYQPNLKNSGRRDTEAIVMSGRILKRRSLRRSLHFRRICLSALWVEARKFALTIARVV